MTRLRLLVLAGLLVSASAAAAPAPVAPTPAQATTCAQYSNQADAQRAADTRDGDGDGIYCEALKCPCVKPGAGSSGGGAPAQSLAPAPRSRPGRSVTLVAVRHTSGCRVRGPLPDAGCTPGARFARVTKAQVCRRGYSKRMRYVTASTKAAVYAAYAIGRHFDGADGEVDHLVSLELGGSNARSNLFPQAATPRPGSHEKDRLENRLHADLCAGRITLRRAQGLVAGNWVAAYHRRFG